MNDFLNLDTKSVPGKRAHDGASTRGPGPAGGCPSAWFGAFAIYAAAMVFTGHADGTWAVWGCAATR